MILKEQSRVGYDNLVLWKMDLANAFGLLDIRASDSHKMAYAISGNITVIYIRGMFGWAGTPFAFQVISRTLRRLIIQTIHGLLLIYVDDLLGVSSICDVDHFIDNNVNLPYFTTCV